MTLPTAKQFVNASYSYDITYFSIFLLYGGNNIRVYLLIRTLLDVILFVFSLQFKIEIFFSKYHPDFKK